MAKILSFTFFHASFVFFFYKTNLWLWNTSWANQVVYIILNFLPCWWALSSMHVNTKVDKETAARYSAWQRTDLRHFKYGYLAAIPLNIYFWLRMCMVWYLVTIGTGFLLISTIGSEYGRPSKFR